MVISKHSTWARKISRALILLIFATTLAFSTSKQAQAQSCNFCVTVPLVFTSICVCVPGGTHGGSCACNASYKNACPIVPPTPDCMGSTIGQIVGAPIHITLGIIHSLTRNLYINLVFAKEFEKYRQWFARDFFDDFIRQAMKETSTTMSSIAMGQAFLVGALFDAKQQVEVQRVFQELKNEAIRDYTPSEGICAIGTATRSLRATEERAKYNSLALNAASMARHSSRAGTSGASNAIMDKISRWEKFKTTYCNPRENAWTKQLDENGNLLPGGLELACGETGGGNTDRINLDIDFGRLIEQRHTLDISMDNPYGAAPTDREDVLALSKNLFGHNPISRAFDTNDLRQPDLQPFFMDLRAVAARRNVAENSLNAIVEIKSAGGSNHVTGASNHTYLSAILKQLGITEPEDLDKYIGENPSYYAQLEILAKKIYQNPQFFVELYDKPANIERKSIALKAIELMLDRAIYESELRQEMVTSIILATEQEQDIRIARELLIKSGGN